ncbi:MAG TPA: helix-turn-helix domain-containing protein [Blastocatellia bacterium]|nr:helix-turn-helix domain-containing protein [Blastocatellia bacterium]
MRQTATEPEQGDRSTGGEAEHASAQNKDKKSEYLTARQLAGVLQVSEATIHRLRRAGKIPAVMLTDRLIRFNLREVQRALRSQRATADPGDETEESASSPQLSFDDFSSEFG